jgi:hypothetical protein
MQSCGQSECPAMRCCDAGFSGAPARSCLEAPSPASLKHMSGNPAAVLGFRFERGASR